MTKQHAIGKVAVGTAIGAFCLWLALHKVEMSEVGAALESFDWRWLLAAFGVSLLIQVLRAWRWQIELTPLATIPFQLLWQVVSVAYMMINVLPFRLGEPVRPLLLSWKTGLSVSSIVGNWLFEKMIDTAILLILLHVTLMMVDLPPWAHHASMGSFAMFGAMLVLVVGFWLHGETFFDRTVARVLSNEACHKTRKVLVAARAGLQILPNPWLVAKVFVVSMVLWLLPILSSWILIRGFDFDVPVSAAFVIFVCVGLGTAVPNPPGMIGVFQIASVAALGLYGIDQPKAVAYGIVLNAVQLLSLVLQGAIAMPWVGVGLGRMTRAAVETRTDTCPAAGSAISPNNPINPNSPINP